MGASATTRPPDSSTERSHSRAASGRSWVTISIVRSTASSVSISSRRVRGSRFADGSSSTSRLGCIARTVAIATRRLWPRLSWCGAREPCSSMRTACSARLHAVLDLFAREPEVERAEGDVLAHGRHEQLVVGVLEDQADAGAQVLGVVLADDQAGDLEAPAPLQQRVEVEHQRRLAGAVGTEDGDALAVGDVEVDACQAGDAVGVVEAQVGGVDGAAHASNLSRRAGSAGRPRTARRRGGRSGRPCAACAGRSRGRASPGARARRARRCAGTGRWRRGPAPAICSALRGA